MQQSLPIPFPAPVIKTEKQCCEKRKAKRRERKEFDYLSFLQS